jgi:general secretion pathway protein G
MKRSGFTMIELIFVIVILGILASVAIPKLAATRDDAKISKALNELATLKSDFSSYYTAQGKYDAASISSVTNVPLYTAANCTTKATSIASGTSYYYCTQKSNGTLENAVKITVNNTNGALTFAPGTGTGNIASKVSASPLATASINNGGQQVSF